MTEAVKIAIIVEGGVVQAVLTAGVPVEYTIVDYDCDGAPDEELTAVDQGDGSTVNAAVHTAFASPDGLYVETVRDD